jgi:hypothetical protein
MGQDPLWPPKVGSLSRLPGICAVATYDSAYPEPPSILSEACPLKALVPTPQSRGFRRSSWYALSVCCLLSFRRFARTPVLQFIGLTKTSLCPRKRHRRGSPLDGTGGQALNQVGL